MKRPGIWIALIAVLLLVNVAWFVWQGGPLLSGARARPMTWSMWRLRHRFPALRFPGARPRPPPQR